jgi:hypothetical protein
MAIDSTDKDGVNTLSVKYKGVRPVVMVGLWPADVRVLTGREELAEWERRMEAFTGVKWDAKAFITGGGSCCGGDSDGMCDMIG